jgi:hypothetical protein
MEGETKPDRIRNLKNWGESAVKYRTLKDKVTNNRMTWYGHVLK